MREAHPFTALRRASRVLTAVGATAVLSGGLADAAHGKVLEKALAYKCSAPFATDAQRVEVTFIGQYAAGLPLGQYYSGRVTFAVSLRGELPALLHSAGVRSVEGSAAIDTTLSGPAPGTTASNPVTATLASTYVAGPGDVETTAPVNLNWGTPAVPGVISQTLNGVSFSLRGGNANGAAVPLGKTTDSDGSRDTFDLSCTLAPLPQALDLVSFGVWDPAVGQGTPTPDEPGQGGHATRLVVSDQTATSAKLCWSTPSNGDGVVGPGTVSDIVRTGSTSCAVISDLQPATTTVHGVVTRSSFASRGSAPIEVTTLPGTGPAARPYTVAGAATLKTLTRGGVPLAGTFVLGLPGESGPFVADLKLNRAQASLTSLGFLPVTAQVQFVATEPLTGDLTNGALTAAAKLRIKFPKVSLFGVEIGGGANCQTKQVSSFSMKSTQPTFDPAIGGPLAGTFPISDLVGCGGLNNVLSPLTAGKGNAILLNLTPAA